LGGIDVIDLIAQPLAGLNERPALAGNRVG
jgi:hypothetical protein